MSSPAITSRAQRVAILLSTYVNCIRGSEGDNKRRIQEALPDDDEPEAEPPTDDE
jgi:hypothetical protein